MKTLILTEKPSVAMDFAKAVLNNFKRFDGYIEDGNYIITWAVGHLVELLEPHDYNPEWKQWRLDLLPVIPSSFEYKPIDNTQKQYNVIKSILSQRDIAKIIIATDAGREGEVIARTILLGSDFLEKSGNGKDNIERFWTSQALTKEVITSAMVSLQKASDFDRLWSAGQARQVADWLVGMNFSRAATVKMKDLFSVGRVQTAVLALIVERCKLRDNFKPEPYYILKVKFTCEKGSYWGTWFRKKQTRITSLPEVEKLAEEIKNKEGVVSSVKKTKKKLAPPLLYSLTDLQRDANVKFSFSAKKTLDIAQELYEKKKCISYPRTDSKVLGTKNVNMIKSLVNKFKGSYGKYFSTVDDNLINLKNKRVFNDAKLTDHHALIPLRPINSNSSDDENKIYGLVLKRFAAAFHPDNEFEQTEILTSLNDRDDLFRTKGKIILKDGWKKIYSNEKEKKRKDDDEQDQDNLPPLNKGDVVNSEDSVIDSKKTKSLPLYSEALLLKDMTNPGRYVQEKDLKKIYRGDVGLGTQATRAQIIETLIGRRYIIRVKKSLVSTEKGIHLIEIFNKFETAKSLISPQETARWEMNLEDIAQGTGEQEAFIESIKEFVVKTVEEFKTIDIPTFKGLPGEEKRSAEVTDGIAKCPDCDGQIVSGTKAFGCSNWRYENGGCRFVIWKKIAGKEISQEIALELINNKKTALLDGFISKKNKPFSTTLRLVEENNNNKVIFDFSNNPSNGNQTSTTQNKVPNPSNGISEYGKCPVCEGNIIEGKKGYGCSNWPGQYGGCKFVIWKNISGKTISKEDVVTLLNGEITNEISFSPPDNEEFKAKLKLVKTAPDDKQNNISEWTTTFIYS